jgi:hypothetical protein
MGEHPQAAYRTFSVNRLWLGGLVAKQAAMAPIQRSFSHVVRGCPVSHCLGYLQAQTSLPDVCDSILVGREEGTLNVVIALHVRHSSALVSADRVHHIPEGRTSIGEAVTAFRLTQIHVFSADASDEALLYAAHLQAEVQDEAPLIL